MKLLFNENLSFKLCTLLSDLFPHPKPVRELGLERSDDRVVWQRAKDNGFMLVSQDSDFADMAASVSGCGDSRFGRFARLAPCATQSEKDSRLDRWARTFCCSEGYS
jgi:hypothetical protein